MICMDGRLRALSGNGNLEFAHQVVPSVTAVSQMRIVGYAFLAAILPYVCLICVDGILHAVSEAYAIRI